MDAGNIQYLIEKSMPGDPEMADWHKRQSGSASAEPEPRRCCWFCGEPGGTLQRACLCQGKFEVSHPECLTLYRQSTGLNNCAQCGVRYNLLAESILDKYTMKPREAPQQSTIAAPSAACKKAEHLLASVTAANQSAQRSTPVDTGKQKIQQQPPSASADEKAVPQHAAATSCQDPIVEPQKSNLINLVNPAHGTADDTRAMITAVDARIQDQTRQWYNNKLDRSEPLFHCLLSLSLSLSLPVSRSHTTHTHTLSAL